MARQTSLEKSYCSAGANLTPRSTVDCYRWLQRYFYDKELLWFAYFLLIHAYSALVGVTVFFFYGKWRSLWRKYHPVDAPTTQGSGDVRGTKDQLY